MESNFDVNNGTHNERNVRLNHSYAKPPHGTVTTLYYSCDSNIFKSSESSVQVVSASNYNATIGHGKPNFCELDIIAKKEKLKLNVDFVPLQTITEELKSLPMTTKSPGNGFRKKIYHKTVGEEPNEVLCLANVLKDEDTTFTPTLNRYRGQNVIPEVKSQKLDEDVRKGTVDRTDETCQTKKKSRSISRRRKAKAVAQSKQPEELIPAAVTQPKFADLGMAKTMYFVELPNASPFTGQKTETPQIGSATGAQKHKRKKHKSPKPVKENMETKMNEKSKNEQPLGDIVINKIESDFPPLSSPGSATTVPSQAFRKHSDISFDSIDVSKSTKTDFRRHNNSPNSEDTFLDEFLRKYKTDTTVYKGKHRKKHRTSPKLSSEEEITKNFVANHLNVHQQETEVKVIYKVDKIKTHGKQISKDVKKKKKRHSLNTKAIIQLKPSDTHPVLSNGNANVIRDKQNKEKEESDNQQPKEKQSTKPNSKNDSILHLYVADKTLQSESCTMIADDEFFKASVKKKRKSRKSNSRSATPKKETLVADKNDMHTIAVQTTVQEEVALLDNVKDRKIKQRSKSRIMEEKTQKPRHRSKAPCNDNSSKLAKRISRKSASDLSMNGVQNFDKHKSTEGVRKSEDSVDKKQQQNLSKLKKDKDASAIGQTSKTCSKIVEDVDSTSVGDICPYKVEDLLLYRSCKEKRKRSKSYVPKKKDIICDDSHKDKPLASSKSHTFEGNPRSSESHIAKRYPRTKKSKSYLLQNRHEAIYFSKRTAISVKDKLYDDLKKVSNVQHVDASRKRFKVVSKTVRSQMSDGSTTQGAEQSYVNSKFNGSHRFKTHVCTEKEKQAILNLPIFNREIKECTNKEIDDEFVEEYLVKAEKPSFEDMKYENCDTDEVILNDEKLKRKKKARKSMCRREVSFSHLNVSPLMELYKKPSKQIIRRTLLPEQKIKSRFDTAKLNKLYHSKAMSSHSEIISEDTDYSLGRKESVRRFNMFTIILGEKVLEICTKAIGKDGCIMEGFTVSGSEPPKRLRSSDARKDKLKLIAKVKKLHNTFLPPIEIADGVMNMELTLSVSEKASELETKTSIETVSKLSMEVMSEHGDNDENEIKEMKSVQIQANSKEVLPVKSPVLLKTKRKFVFGIKKKSKIIMKKQMSANFISTPKNFQTSTESYSSDFSLGNMYEQKANSTENLVVPDIKEVEEVASRIQKNSQKQEIKNPSRMNSAVKLMESSLQIIKEESQSTDSSSKKSSEKSLKQPKQSELSIKETQTDFNVNDIDKIKEVITYLYKAIDQPKHESVASMTECNVEVNNNSVVHNVTKQDSSGTESSSYHEQFKNFVRNVTPRFCGLKKSSKQEMECKTCVMGKQTTSEVSIPSKIPTLCRRFSTCAVTMKNTTPAESIISDSLSSGNPSSSTSDKKEKKPIKFQKPPKNSMRKRSSSADVLSTGYFEKYKNTKDLIEQHKRKRAESEGSMRKKSTPELEYKSSTSVSDFTSVILSFKDDRPLVNNDTNVVTAKQSHEKYVQCELVADTVRELIDKNIGPTTDDEKSRANSESSKLSLMHEKYESIHSDLKNCNDKSMQTSDKNEDAANEKGNPTFTVLYTDIPYKPKKKMFEGLVQRISSHSFISPRKSRTKVSKEKTQEKYEMRTKDSTVFEKHNKIDKLKHVFGYGDDHSCMKTNVVSYNVSDKYKKTHSKKLPENHYINFLRLERHLEQVLDLYPSICKAIRAQMDDNTIRKLDKRMKSENPELSGSCDTLATTIDTVTEYKNTDSFEKCPSFSENNLARFNECYENINCTGNEYQLQQFIQSQNHLLYSVRLSNTEKKRNRDCVETQERKASNRINKTKDVTTTPYAHTDSTSTSSKSNKISNTKRLRRQFKIKTKKNKNKIKVANSVSSEFSKDAIFFSSSSSDYCRDNWSIASPLYSVTTPSLNISLCRRSLNKVKSSNSLILNKPVQPKITKSQSVIEMSSLKGVNRKLTIQHLLEANHVMKKQENKQNVLVVSVNSSCTVFATPSKFLAKVEKHLKKGDDDKPLEKINVSTIQKEARTQIDEQSFHSLFFSNSKNADDSPNFSEKGSHKPFYIHDRKSQKNTDDEFPDSLEVKPPTSSINRSATSPEDEDLGNFSADSLETGDSKYPAKPTCIKNKIKSLPHQSFLVYSNTVDYSKNSTKSNDKKEDKNKERQQSQATQAGHSKVPTNREDTSYTLLSESGYESNKSKRTASIRNFFKKGGSLLDIFRNSSKNKLSKNEICEATSSKLTNFSNLWQKKNSEENEFDKNANVIENSGTTSFQTENTVYWTSARRDSSVKSDKTSFSEIASPSQKRHKSPSPEKTKGTPMSLPKKCPCSDPVKSYQRQMDECHAYAEKVVLESQMRREGYYKQYQDFKEIPLELMIGKRVPNKFKNASQEVSVQTKPKSRPTSTQSRKHTKAVGVDASNPVTMDHKDVFVKTEEPIKFLHTAAIVFRSDSPVHTTDKGTNAKISKDSTKTTEDVSSRPSVKVRNVGNIVIRESQSLHNFFMSPYTSKEKRDQSTSVHISRKDKPLVESSTPKSKDDKMQIITKFRAKMRPKSRSKSRPNDIKEGCTCDGSVVLPPVRPAPPPPKPVEEPKPNPEPTPEPGPIIEADKELMPDHFFEEEQEDSTETSHSPSISESNVSVHRQDTSPKLFIDILLQEMIDNVMISSDSKACQASHSKEAPPKKEPAATISPTKEAEKESTPASPPRQEAKDEPALESPPKKEAKEEPASASPPKPSAIHLPSMTVIEKQEDQSVSLQKEPKEEPEVCRKTSDDFRKGLTDKEVFDKLLNSFEKEDEIAVRLSKDEDFFKNQIDTIKKESEESIEEATPAAGADPNETIYSDDPIAGKHRSTHFWEEKMKVMREKEENPVKEDDIGTCFSRGFRPDNIALSGDACFSLNKQDRLKFPKGMLTNEESIIDFSERETPLDYLLALGFMVDEASNALKDEDIRSRLLAAITEARVWINKITTTQGTLLYLVAYKSRPKTMRYFLQLVEAIINKRINNAIKLDGFLRILEKVEEGEIQMINILGADKFEDEENEEKIVKKQLRQLFITVYKIAEKEAMMKGKQLSQQAIVLLRILAAKYRAGLHPHLELIARYIGQELLNTETQLEAAMIFLSRLDTAEVKLKEFEAYCDIKCDRKRKKSQTKEEEFLKSDKASPESDHHIEKATFDPTVVEQAPTTVTSLPSSVVPTPDLKPTKKKNTSKKS